MENNVEQAIKVLNEALEMDKEAVTKLFEFRVPCNDKIAEHKDIQVLQGDDKMYTIGLLGLINGILGARESDGWGKITMCIDDNTGKIIEFKNTSEVRDVGNK